jgi:type IV pilus assembly protein PilO
MALMPKGQREQVLVFVAFLAIMAAGAYWHFVYQGKMAEVAEKRTRLEALVAANQKARTEMAKGNLEQLRAQLARSQATLRMIRDFVPASNEVPALLEQVSTAARREGLELAAVDPQPVIEGEHYNTYRYDIGVIGGYHALAGFLTNVGSLKRIVAPVNLRLTPPTSGAAAKLRAKPGVAAIEARFQIQTYVARRSAPDVEAAVPISAPGAK